MTKNWFKSPLICVISPLTQPQVANQQQKKKPDEFQPKQTAFKLSIPIVVDYKMLMFITIFAGCQHWCQAHGNFGWKSDDQAHLELFPI